jgi:hypothetical protein
MYRKTFETVPYHIVGENGDFMRLEVMVVAYGSPEHKDLGGDWFDKKTDFGDKYVKTLKAYYDHGVSDNPFIAPQDQLIGRATFIGDDDVGRWYEFEIDKAHRYYQALSQLLRTGKMGASTQAYPHGVKRLPDGYIPMWHESEVSLTMTPMNVDTIGQVRIKSQPLLLAAQLKAIPQSALRVTDGMKASAERGLRWRAEYGRGGTEVGIARARQILRETYLTPQTWLQIYSYFRRHAVDKQAPNFYPEPGEAPSNGRIAWELWGGDAGESRSAVVRRIIERERESEV